MSVDDITITDEDVLSKKFQDECHREITRFLQEMQEKHDGLSYVQLFEYTAVLQSVMMEFHLRLEEEKASAIEPRGGSPPNKK